MTCADLDEERVRALAKGEVPILEEGLPALVAEGLGAGRLRFVVGAATAARGAEFVFLCVQTPQSETGAADLSAVEAVVREVAAVLRPGAVVVNKSTMPVGSTQFVARELSQAGARDRRRRGVESGVPPRGQRGARLPPAEPRRDRV